MSEQPLPAGDFSAWAQHLSQALEGARASDVPCDGCTACCTSSQFIHIGPDETETLRHIPAKLRFPAPGLPRGHVVLGYDERGQCPMLVDQRCSIYAHRPRTCRTYDCRVFPAAGVQVEPQQAAIGERAARWQFSFPSEDDLVRRDAVRAAATFLREHAGELPPGSAPAHATPLAVLALRLHPLFLGRDPRTGRVRLVAPGLERLRAELMPTLSSGRR